MSSVNQKLQNVALRQAGAISSDDGDLSPRSKRASVLKMQAGQATVLDLGLNDKRSPGGRIRSTFVPK